MNDLLIRYDSIFRKTHPMTTRHFSDDTTLAISGAFLAANNLFGGTSSHSRLVVTQLQLEKIIFVGTVKWNELERKLHLDEEKSLEIESRMFQLIVEILEKSCKLIIDETNEWGETLKDAITDFEMRYRQSQNE